MKYKLLKDLYDCFYTPPELPAQKQEIEECHQALSEVLGKRGFSEGKHNFFPIPLWEVNANSALNNTTEGTEE